MCDIKLIYVFRLLDQLRYQEMDTFIQVIEVLACNMVPQECLALLAACFHLTEHFCGALAWECQWMTASSVVTASHVCVPCHFSRPFHRLKYPAGSILDFLWANSFVGDMAPDLP